MITNKQLSQGVSIIPVFVSAIVLIIGGSWFITYESYTYTASDDIVDGLVKNSDFNFYLDEVDNSQYDGLDKTGNREDSTISYADSGYEQRGIVFYNLSLIVYAISFIALLSSILIACTYTIISEKLFKFNYNIKTMLFVYSTLFIVSQFIIFLN